MDEMSHDMIQYVILLVVSVSSTIKTQQTSNFNPVG